MSSARQDRRNRRDLTWSKRAVQRVGRRGAFLLLVGFIFILRGNSFLYNDFSSAELAAYEYAFNMFVPSAWGILFMVSGVIAASASVLRTTGAGYKKFSDATGFAALQGVALAWACSKWLSVAFGDGGSLALRGALSWTIIVALVALIAGWEEAPR